MITDALITYIRTQLAQGMSREGITSVLVSQGWTMDDIQGAFAQINPVQSPHKVKSPIGRIAVIVIAIVLLAGGAFAYYMYLAPHLSSLQILQKSIQTLSDVKSFSYDATIQGQTSAHISGALPYDTDSTIQVAGSVDMHVPKETSLTTDISLDAFIRSSTTTNATTSIEISSVYTGQKLYADLKKLNVSFDATGSDAQGFQMLVGMIQGFAASIENKWILIGTSTQATVVVQKPLSPEDARALKEYFSGMQYLKYVKNEGDDSVDGIPTYHLYISLQDDGGLVDLLSTITKKENPEMAASSQYLQQQNNLATLLKEGVDFDVWIGKNDFRVYKITTEPIHFGDLKSGVMSDISFEATFARYNQSLSIEAPTNYVTLESLLQKMFMSTPPVRTSKL